MAYERFNTDNAAMLLIDHQVGTIDWMHSAPQDEVKRNTEDIITHKAVLFGDKDTVGMKSIISETSKVVTDIKNDSRKTHYLTTFFRFKRYFTCKFFNHFFPKIIRYRNCASS